MAKVQTQDLRGKVAVVTGATKGIGRAIALDLALRGAVVICTFSSLMSAPTFKELENEIEYAYRVTNIYPEVPRPIPLDADITYSALSAAKIWEVVRRYCNGKVDIVVLNAAVMALGKTGEGAVNDAFLDRYMAGNLKFPVLLMEELVSNGAFNLNSRVIAISSEGVRAKRPAGGVVYAATKAGMESLVRSWADELGKRPGMEGTTFNSVSVGFTKTDAYNKIPPELRNHLEEADAREVAVAHRIGEAKDVADVVGLLVSEKARWISGSVVDASGGKAKIM
ncbi:short-chain dehydrogenase [Delitschia confertaspora ATCC 74209]|uniref:Short-chain dehydrogenase n=1 Tax=Delitschia confertaspora ATCC 74209 TaxID=1513339 RepID=A0A9P4JH03_9PLEO|nr:short-chain dehydrogenase [Delitschia confertaspora ATCC 74209]